MPVRSPSTSIALPPASAAVLICVSAIENDIANRCGRCPSSSAAVAQAASCREPMLNCAVISAIVAVIRMICEMDEEEFFSSAATVSMNC